VKNAPAPADAWAIVNGYEDALGNWREIPEETRAAVRKAMGDPGTAPADPVMIVRRGERKRLRRGAEILLEDGGVIRGQTTLPRDLPLGYHTIRYADRDHSTRLIVSPGSCYLPEDLRAWGWSAQLYALRSAESWGIGDFADLARLARWSKGLGAALLLINPLQTASPILPQQPSPYFPSSRRFRNLLYLRIEEIAGAAELGPHLERLAAQGRALNTDRRIDRDAVFKLKMDALRSLWPRFHGDAAFDRFCREQGEPLQQFATFCALAERHGSDWHSWPSEYRDAQSPDVQRFVNDHGERIHFYQWLQWLLDEQLARAAREVPLMQDLPIGVDPAGADVWAWPDVFARGVTVGAPPDEYNTQGQDWGFPPLIPWKLRQAGYEPFIQTIRATLRHAGGLRIDHIMGLFRLFWIPQNASPEAGAYVRYAEDELLAILALESQRAGAYIVGEDLGTIDENFRRQLMDSCVLSYRLIWFENDPPADFPQQALAAVTTHDLPTIAGLWTGSDLKVQHELGLKPNEKGIKGIRARLAEMAELPEDASVDEVIRRTYRLLGKAPSRVLSATLDDALAVEERPNMPGTTGEQWPSWSFALPQTLEDLERLELARDIAEALHRR
jgi:4-alpha-glucanotransferase